MRHCGEVRSIFQSTLPRRERRSVRTPAPEARIISIHAPAKGATLSRRRNGADGEISIHAPAKGATLDGNFAGLPMEISIHAPAKGATAAAVHRPAGLEFQSTLPRRERPYLAGALHNRADFNPRSREGSDMSMVGTPSSSDRFQSTLPRRERPGG